MADENEKNTNVGFITAVEDTNGEMIKTDKIDSNKRKEWIEHLNREIESIDGVNTVSGGGYKHQNYQTVRSEVILDVGNRFPNVQSISQKLRYIFSDKSYVSSYEVIESPRKQESGDYDISYYIVDIYLV